MLMCVHECLCVCMGICKCICVYMYVLVYICIVLCMCTGVYQYVYIFVFVWVHVCSFACCSVSDSFVQFELSNKRFGVVPVMDPILWRFEDRPMRWSRDQYRFVLWRSDSDSISKLHHFMWVFVLVYFLIYYCQ